MIHVVDPAAGRSLVEDDFAALLPEPLAVPALELGVVPEAFDAQPLHQRGELVRQKKPQRPGIQRRPRVGVGDFDQGGHAAPYQGVVDLPWFRNPTGKASSFLKYASST